MRQPTLFFNCTSCALSCITHALIFAFHFSRRMHLAKVLPWLPTNSRPVSTTTSASRRMAQTHPVGGPCNLKQQTAFQAVAQSALPCRHQKARRQATGREGAAASRRGRRRHRDQPIRCRARRLAACSLRGRAQRQAHQALQRGVDATGRHGGHVRVTQVAEPLARAHVLASMLY